MRGSGGVVVVIVSGCTVLVPLDDLLPSILLDHVSKLDYKLALFILLARLERVLLKILQRYGSPHLSRRGNGLDEVDVEYFCKDNFESYACPLLLKEYASRLWSPSAKNRATHVFPPKGGLAALAVNVSDSMKAS